MHPDAIARLSARIGNRYRIERELGGGGMSRVFLATLGMGNATEAASLLQRSLVRRWNHPGTGGLLAYALATAGRPHEARAVIDSLRKNAGGQLPASGATAAALEELGDHAAAVALLTRAIAWHDPWVVQFPQSVRYDKLRRDPRVDSMLTRLGTMAAVQ